MSPLEDSELIDIITLVHLTLRVPLLEPERLTSALAHAEAVSAQSEAMWQAILAETDNDHEWIPNGKQEGILGAKLSQEQIDSWLGFVSEAKALWAGEKLIPHWRLAEGYGINMRKVLLNPSDFDLVMWLQGSLAAKYSEQGEVVSQEMLENLWQIYGEDIFGFAAWFN
ncbi:MAG: hypothetical protein R2880_01180 [Deinococcales bacterium]